VRAIKLGAYDFLTKPFSVDDLMLAVNQGLERRRLSLDAKRALAAEAEARRLAEDKARLEELDRAKRQFYRLVTHELQAPVAGIQNYLQLILDGYVPPEKLRDVVEKCMARAQEEMDLVADLLELGRLQAADFQQPAAPVRLSEVLEQVMDALHSQAAQKNLRLNAEVVGEIPPVIGSASQFKSVWTNLIGNAIKYTPSGGAVGVSLRAGNDLVIGEVRDTGLGIPAEDQPRLFTEFFRAGNAKAQNIRGTGLGLAIVKQIVEGAGGKILVESEAGHGSAFTFVLPAAPA
jgi:signal transduction histidine kinase